MQNIATWLESETNTWVQFFFERYEFVVPPLLLRYVGQSYHVACQTGVDRIFAFYFTVLHFDICFFNSSKTVPYWSSATKCTHFGRTL